jgi:DNA polymerase-1
MQAELVGFRCVPETRPIPAKGRPAMRRWPIPTGSAICLAAADCSRARCRCEALDELKALLEDPSVLKIGQNLKYDMLVMRSTASIASLDDTMLLSYVLDAGPAGMAWTRCRSAGSATRRSPTRSDRPGKKR